MEGLTFDRSLIFNNDFGDRSAETGRYYSGLWFRKFGCGLSIDDYPYSSDSDFIYALNALTPEAGIIVRAPEEPYNIPFKNKFSPGRDQQHPLEVAASLWATTSPKGIHFNHWLRMLRMKQDDRFMNKYQNMDFPNPSHWAVTGRYLDEDKSYFYQDTFLLAQSYLRLAVGDDNVADDLNHTLLVSQAMQIRPSRASFWARDVFKKRSPLKRWQHYYRKEVSTLYGMPELWRPWIERTFG